jgi:hypothetical protein
MRLVFAKNNIKIILTASLDLPSKKSLRSSSFMGNSNPSTEIRMALLMALLGRRLPLLLLIPPLLLLYLQQDLIQVLLLDILRKVGKDPRVNQRLQRGHSCLRVNHQNLLEKGA